MPIATTCPNCKALFRLSDDMAGQKVKCQKCQHVFVVPKAGDNTLEPGVSVSKPPAPMELAPKAPQATAAPMVTAAPPDPDEDVRSRVEADDEPARPSRRGAPPAPSDRELRERRPSRRERRSSSSSGS